MSRGAPSRRLRHQFLPAAEEITETPVLPFGWVVVWLVTGLVTAGLAWAYFGQIEVVATSSGTIALEGNTKVVQPVASGVAVDIPVREGQVVKKGDAIARLRQPDEHGATIVTAPVDGTIITLLPKTAGDTIRTTDPIAQIVPDSASLYVDVVVNNQDLGFVAVGQKVVVKVASYSFQRYGHLQGVVEQLSLRASGDESRGRNSYLAKVKLNNSVSSKQQHLRLLPGMPVTAEITTGQRRIIDFLLDPLVAHTDGSLKIR